MMIRYSTIKLDVEMPIIAITIIAMAISLCACSSPATKGFVQDEMKKIVAQQDKSFELPEAVRDAMLRGEGDTITDEVRQKTFDVSVINMPAKSFFLSLVANAGINVVVDPSMKGAITLELNQVTVADVLKVTRDVFGYEYKFENNIYTIFSREMRTEVYPINYIDVKREGETVTSVIIGEIESSSNSSNNNSGNSNNRNGRGNNSGNDNKHGMQSGTGVKTTHKTDFWHSLELAIKTIVGTEKGSMVVVNSQAGLVVVKSIPKKLKSVKNFLDRSELSVKRQVILETKILEVSLNDDYKAGVNWNEINGSIGYESGWNSIDGVRTRTAGFASKFDVLDISKFLSLLETQGSVQVLSSPRVSTVNNQKALIRVGVDEFFVTGVRTNTTSSAVSASTSPEVDLTSFFSGISLDVTPQIAEDGDVILHIHPIVSEVKDQQKDFTVDSKSFSLPMALRDVRESDSIVRAKSGQVVVLGGLMKQSSTQVNGKRPLLGDIPILNLFFRTKEDIEQKSELVILMRPIVAEEGTWNSLLEESALRLGSSEL